MLSNHHRKDAVIVILICIVLCLVLFPNIDKLLGTEDIDATLSEVLKEKRRQDRQYYRQPEHWDNYELFAFDPNTADSTQLLRLGLRTWQVRNIYKYRAAGGRYRKPSDFARLYGLTAEHYRRLLPYIKIQEELMAADVYAENSKQSAENSQPIKRDTTLFIQKIKPGTSININTADTTQLKSIPGIGSYYASRIVKLRQRLGGFYSPNQLKEIENFPDGSLQYMNTGKSHNSNGLPADVSPIRINRQTVKELASHHYISYLQAKQIDLYRRQQGQITSAKQLHLIPSFTSEDIERIAPYLSFD